MKLTYWLFVAVGAQMQVIGPFEGLVACERAAGQVMVAVIEGNSPIRAGTACLNTRHANFKFKEPK